MALKKFIIERDIPEVGTFEREQLRGAAAKSNEVLDPAYAEAAESVLAKLDERNVGAIRDRRFCCKPSICQ